MHGMGSNIMADRDLADYLIAPVIFCFISMLPALVAAIAFGWNQLLLFIVFVTTYAVLMLAFFIKKDDDRPIKHVQETPLPQ